MSLEQEQLTRELLDFIDEEETKELNIDNTEVKKIENTNQANYYVKKVKEIQGQKKEIEETCQRQVKNYTEKVKLWQERMFSTLNYNEEYYVNLLRSYAEEQLEGTNKKSLKLIEGTLSFRKQQPEYNYDNDAAISFIEDADLPYLNIKATVDLDNNIDYEIKDNALFINGEEVNKAKIRKSIDKARLKKDVTAKNGKAYINGTEIKGVSVKTVNDSFAIK